MSSLIPVHAAGSIVEGITEYLTTSFSLADKQVAEELKRFLSSEDSGMFHGPYVRSRLPYAQAENWKTVLGWLPSWFVPYHHQKAAFERLRSQDENGSRRPEPTLVVTGTGSGKTESFLYPILDHARRARAEGETGVKAVLLYPMNALANDQADRLAELIHDNPELKGVTAGIYTGEARGHQTIMTRKGLINDREAMRVDPPDLLITNYKMLDRLLLQQSDRAIWEKSATSLQYLVLDEFHTYDGAQGTDVALLLRRLGIMLKNHQPEGFLTPAEQKQPLGRITPVATSATLGSKDEPDDILEFARTIFGEKFTRDTVVSETMLSMEQWRAEIAETFGPVESIQPTPTAEEIEDVLKAIAKATDNQDYAKACVDVFCEKVWHCSSDLESAIKHYANHELTAAILKHAAHNVPLTHREQDEQPTLPELVLGGTARIIGILESEEFLVHALTAMAELRARYGEKNKWQGKRLPGVETHLWVREVSRIDRAIGNADSMFRWSDDGVADSEDSQWLPACYCRSCGRSGWMTSLEQGTDAPIMNEQEVRNNSIEHARRQRALLDATPEQRAAIRDGRNVVGPRSSGDSSSVVWFHTSTRELSTRQPTPLEEESGSSIPVLTFHGSDDDEKGEQRVCPSCGDTDSIRYLGSGVSTLLSVSLSNLFGMTDLDGEEKKTLVFTDSVQDAAHRAGYVQARSRAFALRTYARSAVGNRETTLDKLADRLIDNAETDRARYELLPPDLVEQDGFRDFWHPDATDSDHREATRQALSRLSFDLALEFGQRADLPRSLALTGSLSVFVDVPRPASLSAAKEALGNISAPTLGGDDENLHLRWVQGALEMVRARGGVRHEWFEEYLRTDGNPYMLNRRQSRAKGIPGFAKGGTPEFPRIGPTLTGAAQRNTGTTSLGGARGRFALWTSRILGLGSHDASSAVTSLFAALQSRGVLSSVPTDSGGTIYGLSQDRINIASESSPGALECDVCHAKTGVPAHIRNLLDAVPCFTPGCIGHLRPEDIEDNYYRRLYSSTQPRTVVAREHTGLLEKDVRLKLEQSFRGDSENSAAQPDAPNVLVATPTLEMGIDIGDLSTVMLASLPTSVASYIQRVGRAGRLSGNSLVLAIVRGRGLSLPRLNQPLSMINGSVTPPVAYLSAGEILHRQFLAFLIDSMDVRAEKGQVRNAIDVYDDSGKKTSLSDVVITHVRNGISDLLGSFAASLADHVSEDSLKELNKWASGEGADSLIGRLTFARKDWKEEIYKLSDRLKTINNVLDELDARVNINDDDSEEEKRKANASRRAILKQLKETRSQDWIGSMERFGLLPNFTLLDDNVELNVSVTSYNHGAGYFETTPYKYSRGVSRALHELAPGATFYAQGIAALIDAVEIGEGGADIEQWRICPVCSYSQVEDSRGGSCPSCGTPAFADKGQVLDVVPMRRVSSEVEMTRATIGDTAEERYSTRFSQHVSFVVPEGGEGNSWYLEVGFGIKHLPKVDLRWLNLGNGNGETRSMGSNDIVSPLFRVCRHCGHVDSEAGTNSKWDHRPWCSHRYETDEDTATFALGRTLRTQGVLMYLPEQFGSEAHSLTITSLIAAIKLGFREVLGGDPDHLDVTSVRVPRTSGTGATDALLLHDQVPGGTGYLDQFADPQNVRSLIERAWERVANCSCQHDERLACPDCLLPYARGFQVPSTSRAAAERALRSILRDGPAADPLSSAHDAPEWSVKEEQPESSAASQLELQFRVLLRKSLKDRNATIKDKESGGYPAMDIEMPSGVRWRMREQVKFKDTQPDFYFEPLNGRHRPIAVFTDGAHFHISSGIWRIHDDIQKRNGLLLEDEHILPWSLTSLDLNRFTSPDSADFVPDWFNKQGNQLASANEKLSQASLNILISNPFKQLLEYLNNPASKYWLEFPDAVASHMIAHDAKKIGDGREIRSTLNSSIEFDLKVVPSVSGMRMQAKGLRLLPVRPGELEVDTWTTFLNMANIMWLSDSALPVTTSESAPEATVETTEIAESPEIDVAMSEASVSLVIPEAWQEVLDNFSDEDDLVNAIQVLIDAKTIPPEDSEGEEWEGIPTMVSWPSKKIALLYSSDDAEVAPKDTGWTLLFADSINASDIPNSLRG
ncbi:MAG: DEAD/DEAH box helicase [Corynebacterium casei]|uniref:DEAD/DEAH box helicase n=1 Tax=Corynebacterium casei TaxID=160386 RepID=UPI003F912144